MQKTPRRSLYSFLRKPPEASDTQTLADLDCSAPAPRPMAKLYSIKPVPAPKPSLVERLVFGALPWLLIVYLGALAALVVIVLAEAGGLL